MIIAYLALGSNLKTPERQLHQAIHALRKIPKTRVQDTASFFHNKAYGRKSLANYCNTVLKIATSLTPSELLYQCQQIESQQGRVRRRKWDARTLDIDIIFFAKRIIKTPNLTIPHPRILERDFVYKPLLKINPEIRWPNGQLLAAMVYT